MSDEIKLQNLITARLLVLSEKPYVMGKLQNMHKYNVSFSVNTAKKDEPARWATMYMSLIITEAESQYVMGDQIYVLDGQLSLSKYTKKDGTEVTEFNIWANQSAVSFLKHIELKNNNGKSNYVNNDEDDDTYDSEDDVF